MRVIVLGADGYLGWPTSMRFSALGMDVCMVDNYLKRQIWRENEIIPLLPLDPLDVKSSRWEKKTNRAISFIEGDVTDYDFMVKLIKDFNPDAIVHYAEQPSAPYSMRSFAEAKLTLENNLLSSLTLAYAVKDTNPDIHIVKLGTMGEYGTPNIDIEEGFIDINHNGRSDRLLFPRQASSLYHTTKIQDTDLLYLYVRTWGLRVTDLMQGPVYGIATHETGDDLSMFTAFNYDEMFGTVLNRFLVQAVTEMPITVYGSGKQQRGFLNILDTLECVRLAVENPAARGEMRIFNQFTEKFSVGDLAEMVRDAASQLGIKVAINKVENPRVEKEDHYYNPKHTGLMDLGLQPNYLTREAIFEMLKIVEKHANGVNTDLLFPKTKWK